MIFLLTNDKDEFGYICKAKGPDAFLACLSELENEFQIRIIGHQKDIDGRLDYLIEQRLNEVVHWHVTVVEKGEGLIKEEELLVLIGGER